MQTMGRHLHGHGAGTGIFHIRQSGLHTDRIRRGVKALLQRTIKTIAQGANNAAALAEQIQGLRQQLANTGFAVGAGNTDQMHATTWLTIKAPGNSRQLLRQPLKGNQLSALRRHGRRAFRFIGDSGSATSNGIANVHATVLLSTRNGQKQITRTHLAAVQGQFTNQG